MRCVSFLFLGLMGLVACGVEPEPRAPSALDVGPAPGALEYRVHGPDGDSVREVTPSSPDAEWVELAFARPGPGDRVDVESCTRQSCTMEYVPKAGVALWMDVDRATRRPTSVQWIAHDSVESCDHLAFTPDRSAIASATCTRIVDRVGEETVTWTLVGRGS